jgi:hypothetical protein
LIFLQSQNKISKTYFEPCNSTLKTPIVAFDRQRK